MEVDQLLRRIVGVLEELELPYLITGSIATMFYGEPRFTNDIDIVVDLPPERIGDFCAALPEDELSIDEERVRHAVSGKGQFNVIHPRSGLKVDVMIPRRTEFETSRFGRRRREEPASGYTASFASPEDAILKKLEFYEAGGSDKHLRDILGVLEISGRELDRNYIRTWAGRLGVLELWETVVRRWRSED